LNFEALGLSPLSPDGSRVVHATGGSREFFDIVERRADGTGGETLFLASKDDYNLKRSVLAGRSLGRVPVDGDGTQ
jgi:hypothetical protein